MRLGPFILLRRETIQRRVAELIRVCERQVDDATDLAVQESRISNGLRLALREKQQIADTMMLREVDTRLALTRVLEHFDAKSHSCHLDDCYVKAALRLVALKYQ